MSTTSLPLVRPQAVASTAGVLADESVRLALDDALRDVHAIVPPMWSLADLVAVNPCIGLIDQPFLEARRTLRSVRNCDLLMSGEYFQAAWASGRMTREDLQAACTQLASDHPEWSSDLDAERIAAWLQSGTGFQNSADARSRTVAEAVDERLGTTWASHVVNDVSRHCAAHFDEGQAAWESPWRGAALYDAWREAARLSRRMDLLGIPGFRSLVANLSGDPRRALLELLRQLGVPAEHWRSFLLCQAFSVAGWASWIRQRVRQAEQQGEKNEDLVALIVMRLTYDVALARAPGIPWPLPLWSGNSQRGDAAPAPDVMARYVCQLATEISYRRKLLGTLSSKSDQTAEVERKQLQMAFCIDVRSEVMRRHLEAVDASIETFGFAGFFGLPVEYVPVGFSRGTSQCPVLLVPGERAIERPDASPSIATRLRRRRFAVRRMRKSWKAFQTAAASCFAFVEAVGAAYLVKLLTDSLGWTRPVACTHADGLPGHISTSIELAPLTGPGDESLENRRLELAEGLLRNLGLTRDFARVVIFCGHAATVTNNPYRAALDCGACGGHSGEPNARLAASLLNDPGVRAGLAARGIFVPADTWFLAAVHETTTDAVRLCDVASLPPSHESDLQRIERWLHAAGHASRSERLPRLGASDVADPWRRSRDWAELRPEWGLAGNAAFVVAARSRTKSLNLGGRTFLHGYNHASDPDLKKLESIMTAPMIVTNWINMQYYASTVDPVAFGSGNKLLHNVVGRIGVLEGNGGDLMTGLPWQSIHDGRKLQHEPLRLLVVIDAPRTSIERIVEKHAHVRNLVSHGWISLVAWEGDRFYRWTAIRTWEAIDV